MKSKYDIYQPRFLTTDVYDASGPYYRSADITVTPYESIGSLAKTEQRKQPAKLSANSTVFGSNFKLDRDQLAPKSTPPSKERPTHQSPHLRAFAAIAYIVGNLKKLQWAPKKYNVNRGEYVSFRGMAIARPLILGPALLILATFSFASVLYNSPNSGAYAVTQRKGSNNQALAAKNASSSRSSVTGSAAHSEPAATSANPTANKPWIASPATNLPARSTTSSSNSASSPTTQTSPSSSASSPSTAAQPLNTLISPVAQPAINPPLPGLTL